MEGFVGVELRPGGTLLLKALRLLSEGPRTTESLAVEVLALRGNPHIAAEAVFTLLGSESRVRVDASGVWSLAEVPVEVVPAPLRLQPWVVVDVETTGGSPARGHRVIEVAAVQVIDGRIGRSYSSLVNPRRSIPRMITSLTSISNEMVASAPYFEEVAPELGHFLSGKVFVGHNATFDWRFLEAEMERCSEGALSGTPFCTLRLARRLLPHLPSRALGALANYFNLPMETQHRALDDALATAHLLLRLLEKLEEKEVTRWDQLEIFLQKRSPNRRTRALPRSVDAA